MGMSFGNNPLSLNQQGNLRQKQPVIFFLISLNNTPWFFFLDIQPSKACIRVDPGVDSKSFWTNPHFLASIEVSA